MQIREPLARMTACDISFREGQAVKSETITIIPHAQFVSPEVGAGTSCGVDHGPSVELDQRMKVLIGERGLA